MKRKILVSLLFLVLGMFICMPGASAYSLKVGDSVVINEGTESSGNGGAFYVTTGGSTFPTFCETEYEYFSPGGTYIVKTIENDIAPGAAYLMTLYWNGTLPNYSYGQSGAGADLQNALWYLEARTGYNDSVGGPQGISNDYVALADAAIASGAWSGIGNVRGFDYNFDYSGQTYQRGEGQDMYTMVPEPTTMLLLGLGLVGLAGFRRKFKQ